MRWEKCCNFCNKHFLFTSKAGAWHCDINTVLIPPQPPTALPNGNGIVDILGIFPSPLRAQDQERGCGRVLFWNSCRCWKSKGFFGEAHLHLSYAICAKACGVFVCWFDRLTCNGQDPGVAALSKVTLIAGVSLEISCSEFPMIFLCPSRRMCCSNVPLGFLFAFTILCVLHCFKL